MAADPFECMCQNVLRPCLSLPVLAAAGSWSWKSILGWSTHSLQLHSASGRLMSLNNGELKDFSLKLVVEVLLEQITMRGYSGWSGRTEKKV